jgi:hypothetical protein
MLDTYDVVVNDLDIINSSSQLIDTKYLSNRFRNGERINSIKLQCSNMMGLTNTAATAHAFKECIALQRGEALAFDWYLWTTVLLNSREAVFTNKTTTKYRAYENNVAGLPQKINSSSVLKGLEIKYEHYQLMSKINDSYDALVTKFETQLSDQNILKYISIIEENEIDFPVWWEQIKAPSEVGTV